MTPGDIIEKGTERIPTKNEVIEIIFRKSKNVTLVRELSDNQGLFLLEAKVEGEKTAEIIQFEYMRRGRFPRYGEASETAIYKMYYQDDMPIGGEKIAVYNSETGEWEEIK